MSDPDGGSRTRQRTGAALLKAARSVFSEIGFGAAGVRDIVRRTDLASGTFYNYFKDKEEIFEAVVGEMTAELLRRKTGRQTNFGNSKFTSSFLRPIDNVDHFKLINHCKT